MATKKILVVEDEKILIHTYERYFKINGYEIEIARDGEEALEKLSGNAPKPDIILLDLIMPKLNGFEVLKSIKEDTALKDIPVVCLTNLSAKHDGDLALSLGADQYLIKSQFDPQEIVNKVKEILDKRASTEKI